MALACFISPGKDFPSAVARVKVAEDLGYEMVLTTTDCTPADNARAVIAHLVKLGFLAEEVDVATPGV